MVDKYASSQHSAQGLACLIANSPVGLRWDLNCPNFFLGSQIFLTNQNSVSLQFSQRVATKALSLFLPSSAYILPGNSKPPQIQCTPATSRSNLDDKILLLFCLTGYYNTRSLEFSGKRMVCLKKQHFLVFEGFVYYYCIFCPIEKSQKVFA